MAHDILSGLSPAAQALILSQPALTPPHGVIPDLTEVPGKHSLSHAVVVVTVTIPSIMLMMRLYTNAIILRRFNWVDCTLICGWVCTMGCIGSGYVTVRYGAGLHQWNVQIKYMPSFLKFLLAGTVLYSAGILFIKSSILLQYLQVFAPRRVGIMWWSCILLMIINSVFYVSIIFCFIFSCHPVAEGWDFFLVGGHCIDSGLVNIIASTINAVIDFVVLCLPQMVIWRLQQTKKQKLAVSGVFLIGLLIAASVKFYSSPDITYYTYSLGVWSFVEMVSGIVAACLPVAPRFLKTLRGTLLVSRLVLFLTALFGAQATMNPQPESDQDAANNATQDSEPRQDSSFSSNPAFNIAPTPYSKSRTPVLNNTIVTQSDNTETVIVGEDGYWHGTGYWGIPDE